LLTVSQDHSPFSPSVAIIGAGPVGLFNALLLAQSGVDVAVFEKNESLSDAVRAVGYVQSPRSLVLHYSYRLQITEVLHLDLGIYPLHFLNSVVLVS